MADLEGGGGIAEAVFDLEMAAWVGGGDDAGGGGEDGGGFVALELSGHFWAGDVVDASTAAADGGVGEGDEGEVGDEAEEGLGLGFYALAVMEVAGGVVGDDGGFGQGAGGAGADFDEPSVDIAEFGGPEAGFFSVVGVVGEEAVVVGEVAAATAGVADDGVEGGKVETVDQAAGEGAGEFGFAVVTVETAAATLVAGGDDLAVVGEEDVGGVAVDLAEDEVLNAAGEEADAPAGGGGGGFDGGEEGVAEVAADGGGGRFEGAQAGGEEAHEAEGAGEALEAGGLIEPEQAPEQAKAPRAHEEEFDGEAAPESAGGGGEDTVGFDLGAGGLEEAGVVNAGGAGGDAGEAAEAGIHFVAEGRIDGEFAVGDGTHEGDAAAGAVAFFFGRDKGGAGGEAEAAVHALLHDGVVEVAEQFRAGRCGGEGSGSRW